MEMILGVIVSLLVQWLKRVAGASGGRVIVYCVAISMLAAVAYNAIVHLGYWSIVKEVLLTAGAFYAFVVRQVETYAENNKSFLEK